MPASYVGLLDEIRKLYALAPEARLRGYTPSRFSFNVKGGRCETCAGQGKIRKEMSFLPDVFVDCEDCGGERFNEETLNIRYNEKNIADVFSHDRGRSRAVFPRFSEDRPAAQDSRRHRHGLHHISARRATPSPAAKRSASNSPMSSARNPAARRFTCSTNRPPACTSLDVEKLIHILHRLVDLGNTVITIEHNLDIVKDADYLIDLGPEGGEQGGQLVACGSPLDVIKDGKQSYTARFLREYLNGGASASAVAGAVNRRAVE